MSIARRGLVLILASPSGAGKSTLMKIVLGLIGFFSVELLLGPATEWFYQHGWLVMESTLPAVQQIGRASCRERVSSPV